MRFFRGRLEDLCVAAATPIPDVMRAISRGSRQIALVTEGDRRLLGTITDGDVRHALLDGATPETPASAVMRRSFTVGRFDTETSELIRLMRDRGIAQVPLLDESGALVDLVWIHDLLAGDEPSFEALVMAGGFGRRLRPLTDHTPKPMLKVGDRPLMEITVERLRDAGIRRIHVSTHYMAEAISDHFGDGRAFGVEIGYVREDSPLGTAGALGLLKPSDKPLLVINGDILTGVDFRAMLAFHEEHAACLTVAVKEYNVRVPYGVLETDGPRVVGMSEKPSYRFFINAGIYLVAPEGQREVPRGECLDMSDLIERFLSGGRKVVSFPVQEYWLDIGRPSDYQRAQDELSPAPAQRTAVAAEVLVGAGDGR